MIGQHSRTGAAGCFPCYLCGLASSFSIPANMQYADGRGGGWVEWRPRAVSRCRYNFRHMYRVRILPGMGLPGVVARYKYERASSSERPRKFGECLSFMQSFFSQPVISCLYCVALTAEVVVWIRSDGLYARLTLQESKFRIIDTVRMNVF